jgi:deazaflavin-dependent oxidoreductase (nitroreductase family)
VPTPDASPSRRTAASLNRIVEPLAQLLGPPKIGPGIVLLETTGRRTGLPRRVPLLAWRIGPTVLTSTIRPSSDWVRNLEATPDASVWTDGRRRPASACVARAGRSSLVRLRVGGADAVTIAD